MALTVGIIGLPQSGKTTLFNALTRAGADISGYPTSTVQANRAVVEVPDERLGTLADIFHPRKVVPATVEFVDVAGIGQAAEGARPEGLSAEFLGHIRNADALAIVVRCFNNPAAPHPAGSLDASTGADPVRRTDANPEDTGEEAGAPQVSHALEERPGQHCQPAQCAGTCPWRHGGRDGGSDSLWRTRLSGSRRGAGLPSADVSSATAARLVSAAAALVSAAAALVLASVGILKMKTP